MHQQVRLKSMRVHRGGRSTYTNSYMHSPRVLNWALLQTSPPRKLKVRLLTHIFNIQSKAVLRIKTLKQIIGVEIRIEFHDRQKLISNLTRSRVEVHGMQALALLSNAYLEPAELCRIAAIVVLEMTCWIAGVISSSRYGIQ